MAIVYGSPQEPIRYESPQEMYSVLRGGAKQYELQKAKKNSKGIKIKLIDAITEPKPFNLPVKNDKGQSVYRYITFEPGVLYKVPDDTFLKVALSRGLTQMAYKESLEQSLKEANIPYEIKVCSSCGGGLKKIKVQIFEVIGDEEHN